MRRIFMRQRLRRRVIGSVAVAAASMAAVRALRRRRRGFDPAQPGIDWGTTSLGDEQQRG